MSNCQISLSIKEVTPIEKIKISITNFSFQIKSEVKEGEIKLQDKSTSTFVVTISSIVKDVRFSIRLVNKEDNNTQSLIGLSDLLVPFIQIRQYKTNQTFTYEKKLVLSMIDSTKRLLFGSLLNAPCITITIEALVKVLSCPKKKIYDKLLNKSSSMIKSKLPKFNIRAPLSPKIEKNPRNKLKLELENSPQVKEKNNNLNFTEGNTGKKKFIKNKDFLKKNLNFHNQSTKFSSYYSNRNGNNYKSKTITSNGKNFNNSYTMSKGFSDNSINGKKALQGNVKDKRNNSKKNFLLKKNNNDSCLSARQRYELINNESISDRILTLREDMIEKAVPSSVGNIHNEIESLYKKNQSMKDVKTLQEQIKQQYNNLLNFQQSYQGQISQMLKLDENMSHILKKTNELYRTELKKKYKLMEEKEKLNKDKFIKVTVKKNSNENLTSQLISTRKNELKIYQHIFNKFYFEYDILKFSEGMEALNLPPEEKLILLQNCVKNIITFNGSVCRFIPEISEIEYSQIKTKLKIMGINEGNQNMYYKRDEPQAKITEEDEDQEDDGLEVSETPLK